MEMKPAALLGERLSASPAVLQCLSKPSKRVYTVLRAGGCSVRVPGREARVGHRTHGSVRGSFGCVKPSCRTLEVVDSNTRKHALHV